MIIQNLQQTALSFDQLADNTVVKVVDMLPRNPFSDIFSLQVKTNKRHVNRTDADDAIHVESGGMQWWALRHQYSRPPIALRPRSMECN